MGWQPDIIIPTGAERDCKVKPCVDCGAPIRLLEQDSRAHPISVVDATPHSEGWFHLLDDGTTIFARRPTDQDRLTARADFVAALRTHEHEVDG